MKGRDKMNIELESRLTKIIDAWNEAKDWDDKLPVKGTLKQVYKIIKDAARRRRACGMSINIELDMPDLICSLPRPIARAASMDDVLSGMLKKAYAEAGNEVSNE